MTEQPKHPFQTAPMTVDEYLVWGETHPGKYELHDGVIVKMPSEQVGHVKVKYRVQTELLRAIKASGLGDLHTLADGVTVRIAPHRAYEPDALVYAGAELPDTAIEIPNPVIVVEVLSPSTANFDATQKLIGYFGVPSIAHYLIVHPAELPVILHSRQADGTILTRLLQAGSVMLDPPGIEINISSLLPVAKSE